MNFTNVWKFSTIGALLLICLCLKTTAVFASTVNEPGDSCWDQAVPCSGGYYEEYCYPGIYYCPNAWSFQLADNVTLTASQSGQQFVRSVTLTASASGATTNYYRYLLWYNSGSGWVEEDLGWHVGAYSFIWTPPAGSYAVAVSASANTLEDADVITNNNYYNITYDVNPTSVTISPVNPQIVVGNPQTFTATGAGSSHYEYDFYLAPWNGSSCNWASQTHRGWSSTSTWTVNPAAGEYCVEADVRTQYGDLADSDVTIYTVTYAADPTGVTISPVDSQQIVGTPQTFTATGQGSSHYEYYFYLAPWDGTTCNWASASVRTWSSTNTWAVNPAAGMYCVEADVRTQYGDLADSDVTIYTVTYAADPTGVTISPVDSQKIAGNPQTFTATGQGSSHYEYYFYLAPWDGTTCNWASASVRTWSSTNTWTVNPAAGMYCVEADVRTQYGDTADAVVTGYTVTYAADPTGVTISPVNPENTVGTPVIFTATGQGSTHYEYDFFLGAWNGSSCVWTNQTERGWSSTNTWTLNQPAGEYCVYVEVRTQYGDTAAGEVTLYSVTNGPPPQSVSLSANPSYQQITGHAVTFTASASGSGSSYFEYSFWMGTLDEIGTTCTQDLSLPERDWGSSPTWTTNMPAPGGNYCVVAYARTQYENLVEPVESVIDYSVTHVADPTGVTLTANPPNGQSVGNPVTFTAQGQGSSYYEYDFLLAPWNGSFCNWASLSEGGWSPSNTWTLPNLAAGIYCVEADVRTEFGETADADVILYSISALPPTDQPFLSAPANGAYVSGFGVTFTWTAVDKADTYILLISTHPMFQSNVTQYVVSGATEKYVSGIFNNTGEVYYWIVAGANSGGTGPFSYAKDFTNGMLQVSAVNSTVEGFKTSTDVCSNSTTSVVTGAVSHDQELFGTKGGPLGGGIQLFYNSLPFYNGPLGIGWSHSYDTGLTVNDDGSILLRDGSGARSYYAKSGNNYVSPQGDFSTLVKNGDNSFTITYRDGMARNFSQDGKIFSIIDRFSNALSFVYTGNDLTSITDPAQRSATIHYDQTTTPHRIDYIIDPNGKRYDFAYQGNTLWKVTYPAADPAVSQERGYWEYLYDPLGQGFMLSKKDPEGHLSQYTYYDDHRMWKAIDPEGTANPIGHTRTIDYPTTTGNLRTATFTEKDGSQWLYTYDVLNGVLKEKSDPNGKITSFTYYPNGLLKSSTDPKDGNVRLTTFYAYDSFGNLLTRTEPVDLSTWIPAINPATVADPATLVSLSPPINPAFSYSYDTANFDRIIGVSDLRGTMHPTTTFVYTTENGGEVVTATTTPGNFVTTTKKYPNGTVKEIIDANRKSTTFSYYPDTQANRTMGIVGLLWTAADLAGITTTITSYDKNGNPLEITLKDTAGTVRLTSSQQHDALNRLKQLTKTATALPVNVTSYSYDLSGNLTVKDAEQNSKTGSNGTRYEYNFNGQVTKITDSKLNDTVFNYSGSGCPSCGSGVDRLTGVYDAKFAKNTPLTDQPNTAYSYDTLGRLEFETDPIGKRIHYTYYDNGQLKEKYDATAAIPGTLLVTNTYNNRGQITHKTFTDGTFEDYTYYPDGKLWTAANQNISYTYLYYDNGRLLSVTDNQGRKVSYDLYDDLGQRKQVTILQGAGADQRIIGYDYDAANRPWHVTSSAGTFTYSYDNLGRHDMLTYPNNTLADWNFDDLNRLTAIAHKVSGGATFAAYSYTDFDQVGNRKSVSGNKTESYFYDELYRLLTVTSPKPEGFQYDAVGNRQIGPGPYDTGYVHNAANQMTAGRRLGYGYDNRGNQTTRTQPGVTDRSWTQTWDYNDRLTKVEKIKGTDSRTVTFKYDPFGRRIEKKAVTVFDGVTTTSTYGYLYDNDDIVYETMTDASGTTKTYYTHGPGTDEHLALERNGQFYYYHADGLGSIVAITDAAHTVVQTYDYDSYGMVKPSTSFANSLTFVGKEWDRETGLSLMGFRYYDLMEGRFVSKDPISIGGGINLYGYTNQNPINYVDPTGLCIEDACIAEGTMAVTALTRFIMSPTGQRLASAAQRCASTSANNIAVYISKTAEGVTRYVGITNDFARRAAEHLTTKGIDIEPLMNGLTRSDARAVEQALIETHVLEKNQGTLINMINSISQKNPTYAEQLKRGYELLKSIGY